MRITTPYDYRRERWVPRTPRFRPRLGTAAIALALTAALTAASTVPVTAPAGDPYADGVLPVGDGKIVRSGPQKGYVYLCAGFADTVSWTGIVAGAQRRGPWFTADGTGYRPAEKPHVRGDVKVPGTFDVRIEGDHRVIATNALPAAHGIGQFPVAANDPVRVIDPNPNFALEHQLSYELPAQPRIAAKPSCVGSQVGVLLRSAALLSPVDQQKRDAVAWEVQDECDGHPEPNGVYHFHGPSPCLPGTETAEVIGFALDGFPITGNRTAAGREIFSRDLDECHGGETEVLLDGRRVRIYRYVLTRDWPYSISCFKGTVPMSVSAEQQLRDQRPRGGRGNGSATGAAGESGLDGHGH